MTQSPAAKRKPVRIAAIVVGIVAVLVLLLIALAWFFQRSLIYYPDTSDPGSAVDHFGIEGLDVELQTEDGLTLAAWRVEPGDPNGMAVLYLPGNGGNRLGRADIARGIADEGFTVLLVDYRGYGSNPGSPSEEGLILDADAAVDHLAGEGFELGDLIYAGESMGTGVATALAVERPPGGVVLRSPFTSLHDVARNQFGVPLGWLARDHFDTENRIADVTAPVTVLAGDADTLVPAELSERVAEAAPELHDLVVLPGAGHNDAIWFGPFLAKHVRSLADALNG